MKKLILIAFLVGVLVSSMASAVIVDFVSVESVSPGETGLIRIGIENILDDKVTDVSLRLDFTETFFTPIGSSEEGVDELREGEEEDFAFRFKVANDISPGDYQIPYTLKFDDDGTEKERFGSIGITVKADTELSFSADVENPVIGQDGKVTLKIINKGFSDAKFVSVKIFPEGYTLLSEKEIYIGTVDSDDFESATFDVIFNNKNVKLIAIIEYKDFDNLLVIENVNMPLTVYTKDRAVELGIIQKSNTVLYGGIVLGVIILWFIWRSVRKSRRLRKSKEGR